MCEQGKSCTHWHNLCIKTIRARVYMCVSVIKATMKRIILFLFHSLSLSKRKKITTIKTHPNVCLIVGVLRRKKYIQSNNAWDLSYLMSKVCNNERTRKNTSTRAQIQNDCRWLLNIIIIIRILMAFLACIGNESWFFPPFFRMYVYNPFICTHEILPGLPLPQSH